MGPDFACVAAHMLAHVCEHAVPDMRVDVPVEDCYCGTGDMHHWRKHAGPHHGLHRGTVLCEYVTLVSVFQVLYRVNSKHQSALH